MGFSEHETMNHSPERGQCPAKSAAVGEVSYLSRISSGRKSVKRAFWFDADTYQKLMGIRSRRRHAAPWPERVTFTAILADALHQFIKKHGSEFPRGRRVSVSLPRRFSLALTYASAKFGITKTDLLNMAIMASTANSKHRLTI
jgi:hypothetical protein